MRTEDRGFRYQALSFRPYGPFHPIQGKVAAIGITRGGVVSAPRKSRGDGDSTDGTGRRKCGIRTYKGGTKKSQRSWRGSRVWMIYSRMRRSHGTKVCVFIFPSEWGGRR